MTVDGLEAPPGFLEEIKQQRIAGARPAGGFPPTVASLNQFAGAPSPRNVISQRTMPPATPKRNRPVVAVNEVVRQAGSAKVPASNLAKSVSPSRRPANERSSTSLTQVKRDTAAGNKAKTPPAPHQPITTLAEQIHLKGTSRDARGDGVAVLQVNDAGTVFVKEGETVSVGASGREYLVTKITQNSVQFTDAETKRVVLFR